MKSELKLKFIYFYSTAKPVIVVKKFGTSLQWIWDKFKFIDRKSFMSEMYYDIKEEGKVMIQ